ncbi:telomere repeat-binding factor 4-like isoform X2 [Malania oleifera]|uniref:telomere repeat-binding factor 4-like isoform X2 n=1 Tax=Malania oleifera TaxID=397392 RepID=UPI0025AE7D83|nr:telomere repeat-binding factor 4-like isoform X2 [Malania oleifera]
MGNQKQRWTSEEEGALLAGVTKHGTGKWKIILKDPEFAPALTHRSNIDLKDKWRNMNMSVNNAAQGSKEKFKVLNVKPITAIPVSSTQNPVPIALHAQDECSDAIMDDCTKLSHDCKTAPRYNVMIFEALSAMNDMNGSDIAAIVRFIEQRHEVPQNFRRLLSSKLRRLVSQGKLEKVQNCFKMKSDILSGTKTPTPKQKDARPQQLQNTGLVVSRETLEEAAITAAYRIADAENKSFVAAEAVKEAERVSRLAEDADSLLELMKDIYEHCSEGEVILLT